MSDKEVNPGTAPPADYPFKDVPAWPKTIGPQPDGVPLHACMGLNSCKASDRFGTTGYWDPAKGEYVTNACAGQGYCSTTPDHTCHVQNNCRNQGGCGLYGTAEELDQPGHNACKSMGSCATPINAERFSTNGPNQGKSVWARARAVFKDRWENDKDNIRSNIDGAPEKLGPVPKAFANTGPPYLWISYNNNNRGNMTSCGASGLSGAGGCG